MVGGALCHSQMLFSSSDEGPSCGCLSPLDCRRILDSLARPLGEINGIQPTILHPHRKSVAEENQRHFLQLDGSQEQCYTAIDSDPAYSRRLDNDLPADSCDSLLTGIERRPYAPKDGLSPVFG